jgi:D-sedoheptulose 7-phosphate isomerase
MEPLYPFLYQGTSDLDAVLDQVRASTEAKISQIIALRETVASTQAARIEECAARARERFGSGGRLFAFGNGGSATDAQQLAAAFMDPGGLPAFALPNDTATNTALSNDIGVQVAFARQLAAFGTSEDIAVGLSTSGNSENMLYAFDQAAEIGMLTIGLAGYDGGKMADLDSIDYLFVVPSDSVHRIQEAQTTIYHVLWQLIRSTYTLGHEEDVPWHTR